jgi:Bbp16
MTMRDLQFSFSDTTVGAPFSLIASTGANLFPNSIDTSPLGAYLTELTAADTQLSANVNTYRELGGGMRLWVVVDITTSVAATGGAATVDFAVITSASSTLGSAVTIYDFGAIAKATLVAGYRLIAALPRTTAWLQYVGLQFTIATNNITSGQAVAWVAPDVDAVDLGAASGFSIK